MSASIQGTGEWLNARLGHLTASRMAAAMCFRKDGSDSAERRALKVELLAERLTGDAVPHYVTAAMQWGIDNEPHAIAALEERYGEMLLPCGFVPHPTIPLFGATPDSVMGKSAVIEVKCPTTTTHLEYLLAGGVPPKYQPQVLAQMACTGLKRAVFASYDPRLPVRQRLMVAEWEPPRERIEEVEAAARTLLDEVETMFQQLSEGKQ